MSIYKKSSLNGLALSLFIIATACLPSRNVENIYEPSPAGDSIVASLGTLDPTPEGAELEFTLICLQGETQNTAIGEVKENGDEKVIVFSGDEVKKMKDGDLCSLEGWGPATEGVEFRDEPREDEKQLYYLTTKGTLKENTLNLMFSSRYRKQDVSDALYTVSLKLNWQQIPSTALDTVELVCAHEGSDNQQVEKNIAASQIDLDKAVFEIKSSSFAENVAETKCTAVNAMTQDQKGFSGLVDLVLKNQTSDAMEADVNLTEINDEPVTVNLQDLSSAMIGVWSTDCAYNDGKNRFDFMITRASTADDTLTLAGGLIEYDTAADCESRSQNARNIGSPYNFTLTMDDSNEKGVIFKTVDPNSAEAYIMFGIKHDSEGITELSTHIRESQSTPGVFGPFIPTDKTKFDAFSGPNAVLKKLEAN